MWVVAELSAVLSHPVSHPFATDADLVPRTCPSSSSPQLLVALEQLAAAGLADLAVNVARK